MLVKQQPSIKMRISAFHLNNNINAPPFPCSTWQIVEDVCRPLNHVVCYMMTMMMVSDGGYLVYYILVPIIGRDETVLYFPYGMVLP